jgi:hypothetical protein
VEEEKQNEEASRWESFEGEYRREAGRILHFRYKFVGLFEYLVYLKLTISKIMFVPVICKAQQDFHAGAQPS